jgi:2-polyprenyl-3-methyl-5-hydroxy-6-metoxy-1,4-benzoquinol methylase
MAAKPDTLHSEYQIRFSKNHEYRNKVWKVLCGEYFSKFIPSECCILDLGCGWGEFINNIDVAKKYGMDLNPDSETHLSNDVCFLHQDCSRPWEVESESFDIIFTSNFLEHLPDKKHADAVISEAFRSLKPNGLIICLGPNINLI